MKRRDIETAIGYDRIQGLHVYGQRGARFTTTDGRTIGHVRHGFSPGNKQARGPWHYHETEGRRHCTRMIEAKDIKKVAP